ncbi:MAG: PEP-CTERM sorting domain-containing protein [Thermodesulfobacteriota bacterium]
MNDRFAAALVLAGILAAAPSQATPLPGTNFTALNSFFAADGIADNYSGINSSVNAATDSSEVEVFSLSGPVASDWLLKSSIAGDYEFGLYDARRSDNAFGADEKLTLLKSPYAVGQLTTVYDLRQELPPDQADLFQAVKRTIEIDTSSPLPAFGFYLTAGATTVYSESWRNANGEDRFLAFEGRGEYVTIKNISYLDTGHWYIAFDLPTTGSTPDYADFVVRLESMQPVPEPATMLLFGSGLTLLTGVARKRLRRK